jgi:hypothetical protein
LPIASPSNKTSRRYQYLESFTFFNRDPFGKARLSKGYAA